MHTSAEADFLTQCSPQQWVSLTQNLGSALVCIMGFQRLERGQKCLETINLLQSKFAAEPFAVQLLNDIILQNHNPSCISGVIIHLQMMHNGVDLVVESDFLPYSKGFYIIYLHIYIWNSINELFDISLLLNFFFQKKPSPSWVFGAMNMQTLHIGVYLVAQSDFFYLNRWYL